MYILYLNFLNLKLVSKIKIEEATQWVRRFDRNLHNTIERETQERHQLC